MTKILLAILIWGTSCASRKSLVDLKKSCDQQNSYSDCLGYAEALRRRAIAVEGSVQNSASTSEIESYLIKSCEGLEEGCRALSAFRSARSMSVYEGPCSSGDIAACKRGSAEALRSGSRKSAYRFAEIGCAHGDVSMCTSAKQMGEGDRMLSESKKAESEAFRNYEEVRINKQKVAADQRNKLTESTSQMIAPPSYKKTVRCKSAKALSGDKEVTCEEN